MIQSYTLDGVIHAHTNILLQPLVEATLEGNEVAQQTLQRMIMNAKGMKIHSVREKSMLRGKLLRSNLFFHHIQSRDSQLSRSVNEIFVRESETNTQFQDLKAEN